MLSGAAQEAVDALRASLASEEPQDEAETGSGLLREALARGDVAAARQLIEQLSPDQLSQELWELSVADYLGFLCQVTADKLGQLNSPQFLPKGRPRVVSFAEVAEQCGPISGPTYTNSFGPRPAGWGLAAAENRVLSWSDHGFGLVGDQVVNIEDRFFTAKPLTAFAGALIAGPMEEEPSQPMPKELCVSTWRGQPLTTQPFDRQLFREIFLQGQVASKELNWRYDFGHNAVIREAFRCFVQADDADAQADVQLAKGVSFTGKEASQALNAAARLDPAVKPWTQWIKAWHEQNRPEALARMAKLFAPDPVEAALLETSHAVARLESGEAVDLKVVEPFQSLFRNEASPYLSWLLECTCDEFIERFMANQPAMGEGGDPELHSLAIRLGYRSDRTGAWLLAAINAGENSFLAVCLKHGFNPVGRFLQGDNSIYLNLLTTAAHGRQAGTVKLLLAAGADPDEPSHYGGNSTWEMAEQAKAMGDPWPKAIVNALSQARRPVSAATAASHHV